MRHRGGDSTMRSSRSRGARRGAARGDLPEVNMDNEWMMMPAFASGTFFFLGIALLLTEYQRESPIPELDQHLENVYSGKQTRCMLRRDEVQEPRCSLQYNHTEYVDTELLCYCPGFVWAKDSDSEQRVEVVLGPSQQVNQDHFNWCAEALQKPWPNVIIFENVATLNWACGVILDYDLNPCDSTEATRSHSHCSATALYPGTRKHHRCLTDLVPGQELPCTRLDDGRLLMGVRDHLVEQLGQHQSDFDEAKASMMVFAAGFICIGFVVVLIAVCCWFGIQHGKRKEARDGAKIGSGSSKIGRSYDHD